MSEVKTVVTLEQAHAIATIQYNIALGIKSESGERGYPMAPMQVWVSNRSAELVEHGARDSEIAQLKSEH